MRRSRKVPFNCYLNIDQLDILDRLSEQEGRPRAEIVREAVEQYLAQRQDPPVNNSEENSTPGAAEAQKNKVPGKEAPG